MTIVCSRCDGNHMRSECPTLGYAPAGEIERLRVILETIRDNAFSPRGDDHIWMDDQTTLGAYIDMSLQRS